MHLLCSASEPWSGIRNRQKRCPKSSATSIGLRTHTLATIAERISHSHPAFTVAGATRIQHHCGTCGDHDATGFFCSALPAHMSRPIPHRSSQFSRPPFFCYSFSRALLRANSCVRQLRVFCFPGSALTHHWVPSHKAVARFGSSSPRFRVPQKNGAEKGDIFMSYLYDLILCPLDWEKWLLPARKHTGASFRLQGRQPPVKSDNTEMLGLGGKKSGGPSRLRASKPTALPRRYALLPGEYTSKRTKGSQ